MKVSPVVTYLKASALLARYGKKVGAIVAPPVPVEGIADLLLELNLSWEDIADTDDAPVLAFIDAAQHTIRLNERRRATHFDPYNGLYEYTLGHEVGHYDLHVIKDSIEQAPLGLVQMEDTPQHAIQASAEGWRPTSQYLCRTKEAGQKPPREYQADLFASYLLMPEYLILPAARSVNLLNWPDLYELRKEFVVSITALTNRLNSLGLLYVAPNRALYRSEAEANGQQRMF